MLNDKLIIKKLQIKSPPLNCDGGRILMPSGELAQIANGHNFRFLAYVEFLNDPTAPRGNHYHTTREEFLYIIKGKLHAIFEDIHTHEQEFVILSAGDLVNVKPFCAHVYFAQEYTQTIEYSPNDFDPNSTQTYEIDSERIQEVAFNIGKHNSSIFSM